MPITNPEVLAFKAALSKAHGARAIKNTRGALAGHPVSDADFKDFARAIFGPTTDANGRKGLIRVHMKRWKVLGVFFPTYVWKTFSHTMQNLHNKSFGDELLEGVIAVASNPAFSAVIGVATAAIPGVGAVLAPLAVALTVAVTKIVKKAHEGNLTAGDVLSNAATVATSSVPAISAAAPALGQAIQTGKTTIENAVATGKQVIATARAVATPAMTALTGELTAARATLLAAKHGDLGAQTRIRVIVRKAKAGEHASVRSLAMIHAVAVGIAHGHIPHATAAERHAWRTKKPLPPHLHYFALPHLRFPFAIDAAAKGAAMLPAFGSDGDSREDTKEDVDGSPNYGAEPSEGQYNEPNEGYDNTEPGDYDDAADVLAAANPDVTEGSCACGPNGATGAFKLALPRGFKPKKQAPRVNVLANLHPNVLTALARTPPAARPHVLAALGSHALSPGMARAISPAIAASALTASALSPLPSGGGGSDEGGGGDGSYGYGEPGASDLDEGNDQPGTFGDPDDYNDVDAAE